MNRESKAKHTKGKWEVSPCNEHDDLHYICSIPNNIVVARTCYATQSEANARLIAASPEMYAMLRFIYSSVDWSSEAWNNDDGQKHKNELESLIKKIEG